MQQIFPYAEALMQVDYGVDIQRGQDYHGLWKPQ